MTKEEFIVKSSLVKGTIIETHYGSIRELNEFVENKNRFGIRFKGIDETTKQYNSIVKYIYLDEINEIVDFLNVNNKITFNEIAFFVKADKKGNCVTHLAIEIITKYLQLGIADYSKKVIKSNG